MSTKKVTKSDIEGETVIKKVTTLTRFNSSLYKINIQNNFVSVIVCHFLMTWGSGVGEYYTNSDMARERRGQKQHYASNILSEWPLINVITFILIYHYYFYDIPYYYGL